MLTEQQVIELRVKFEKWWNEHREPLMLPVYVKEDDWNTWQAAHSEFIKSLGEPKAYKYEHNGCVDLLGSEPDIEWLKILPDDCVKTKLYALPNDEVK